MDTQLGIKYLGYVLNPNAYNSRDWAWMVGKVEKRLMLWCNKWLSRGGRLILAKLILEAILV